MNSQQMALQQAIAGIVNGEILIGTEFKTFRDQLASHLETLINTDFDKLVFLLYRLDISEKKLKEALLVSNSNAGLIIADLIIERQQQKIESRKKYSNNNPDIPDAEKW